MASTTRYGLLTSYVRMSEYGNECRRRYNLETNSAVLAAVNGIRSSHCTQRARRTPLTCCIGSAPRGCISQGREAPSVGIRRGDRASGVMAFVRSIHSRLFRTTNPVHGGLTTAQRSTSGPHRSSPRAGRRDQEVAFMALESSLLMDEKEHTCG